MVIDKPQADSELNQEQSSSLTIDDVSKIVNAAISSRLKSFEKQLSDFASKLPQQKEEPQKEEKLTNTAELLKLKQQLENLQKERELEVTKRRDIELKTSLQAQINKIGVPTHLQKALMAQLLHEDKLVSYEDDQIVFHTSTGDLDLESGLKSWSKSEDAKAFLSPLGAKGSGEKSFNKLSTIKSEKPSRSEVAQQLEQAILTGFNEE